LARGAENRARSFVFEKIPTGQEPRLHLRTTAVHHATSPHVSLSRANHDFFDVNRRAIAQLKNHGVTVELAFSLAENQRADACALA
jgi:hypothetical protein